MIEKTNYSSWLHNSPVTVLLIGINLFVFVFLVTLGLGFIEPDPADLLRWGGSTAALSLIDEPWRLVTSIFLHSGFVHLLMNCYMLFVIGIIAEKKFGKYFFITIYGIGGVLSAFSSAVWYSTRLVVTKPVMSGYEMQSSQVYNTIVSVGASGAIMAICGALIAAVYVIRGGRHDTENTHGKLGGALLQVVFLNLIIGFVIPGIDQAAHVGGLISGFIMAIIIGIASSINQTLGRFSPIIIFLLASVITVTGIGISKNSEMLLNARMLLNQHNKPDQKTLPFVNQTGLNLDPHEAKYYEQLRSLPEPVSYAEAAGRTIKFNSDTSEYMNRSVSMAISSDEKRLYVTNYITNSLETIDTASGKIIQTVKGPVQDKNREIQCETPMCSAVGAADLAVIDELHLALVVSMHKDSVDVVDLNKGEIIKTIPSGKFPRAIRLTPNNQFAVVRNALEDTITVININELKAQTKLVVSSSVNKKSLNPNRNLYFWVTEDSQRLNVFDEPSLQYISYDLMKFTRIKNSVSIVVNDHVQEEGSKVEVDSSLSLRETTLSRLTTGLTSEYTWDLCHMQRSSGFALGKIVENHELIAVAGKTEFTDKFILQVADLTTRVTLGAYPVSDRARDIKFSNDGKHLYVLGNGAISVIDIEKRLDMDINAELVCNPGYEYIRDIVTKQKDSAKQTQNHVAVENQSLSVANGGIEYAILAIGEDGRRYGYLNGEYTSSVMSSDRKTAYISDYLINDVIVLDIPTQKVIKRIKGPGLYYDRESDNRCDVLLCSKNGAVDLAILKPDKELLVASMYPGTVSLVDIANGKILKNIPLGKFPRSIILSNDKTRAYVFDAAENNVYVLDTNTWKTLAKLDLKPGYKSRGMKVSVISDPLNYRLTVDGKNLIIENSTTHHKMEFDTATFQMTGNDIFRIQEEYVQSIPDPVAPQFSLNLAKNRLDRINGSDVTPSQSWLFCNAAQTYGFDAVKTASGEVMIAVLLNIDIVNEKYVQVANLTKNKWIGTYPVSDHIKSIKLLNNATEVMILEYGGATIINLAKRLDIDPKYELLCNKSN